MQTKRVKEDSMQLNSVSKLKAYEKKTNSVSLSETSFSKGKWVVATCACGQRSFNCTFTAGVHSMNSRQKKKLKREFYFSCSCDVSVLFPPPSFICHVVLII